MSGFHIDGPAQVAGDVRVHRVCITCLGCVVIYAKRIDL